jgi:MFS family permease
MRAAQDAPGHSERERRRNPYREVLAIPGALRFSAAGFLGRMPMSMFGLGTVLLIASVTGRYGLAGVVAAAGSLGYAVIAPQAARLADTFGQHQVLRPQVLFFAAATVALVACALARVPDWALLAAGAVAGASMPSIGSMVRARWSALLGASPGLHAAFSFESVADEVIFVIGPALVTLLATQVQPAAGVGVAMAACVTGTLLFAAQRRTEPPVRRPPGRGRPAAQSRQCAGHAAQPARGTLRRNLPGRLPAPGLVTLVPVYFSLGAMFAAIDLSTVAFATERGHRPLAGFVLGSYALGSAIGGLWYGSRTWRAPAERRFVVTLGAVAAGAATFWAMPGLAALTTVIFVSGMVVSPTFIAGFSMVERQAPQGRRTEGMTWLTSAISVGVAAGSAAAGGLLDTGGARFGYLFAACCGAAAFLAAAGGFSRLRQPLRPEAQPAE